MEIHSSNGTIFYKSVYTKTSTPLQVLSTDIDGIPCGVIMHFPGHGDWIYFDGHTERENCVGLHLLEHEEIEKYISSIKKDKGEIQELEETCTMLKLMSRNAHKILWKIHILEGHIDTCPKRLCCGYECFNF